LSSGIYNCYQVAFYIFAKIITPQRKTENKAWIESGI
jgi:hypothetical protein